MTKTTYIKKELVFEKHPTYKRFVDLTGKIFGQLFVLGYGGTKRNKWYCECTCKKVILTRACSLNRGISSCGCNRANQTKHGMSRSKEYKAYMNAKERCDNPNNSSYFNYGGRGIKFKFDSFEQFYLEIGKAPKNSFSIDRIKNNKHYKPGNVKWSTNKEQSNNNRANRIVTINGFKQTLAEACNNSKTIEYKRILTRLDSGWCEQCAFNNPVHIKCNHK